MSLRKYFDVSQAEDVPTFRSRLVAMANALEFPLVTSLLVLEDPAGRNHTLHEVGNIPVAFASQSRDKSSLTRDPVVRRLRSLTVPFVYDQALYVREGAADLWEEQAVFGYRNGISVAVHLPGGMHFFLGVDRDTSLPDDDELSRMMADLQLLAAHAHSAAVRLLTPQPATTSPKPRLTPKEIAVLRRALDSKSNRAIASDLGVTEHAVSFHLRNAFIKLNAATRTQAAMKARLLELI